MKTYLIKYCFPIFLLLCCSNTYAIEPLFYKTGAADLSVAVGAQKEKNFLVTLNSELIQTAKVGTELLVYLSKDKEVLLKINEIKHKNNGTVWKCSISQEYGRGNALFFIKGQTLAGNILLNGIQYTITSIALNNIYEIINSENKKKPTKSKDFLLPPKIKGRNLEMSYATPEATGPTTIDLLILYTQGMADKYTGDKLDSYLNMLVELANQAYEDSGIDLTLRIVGKVKVNSPDDSSPDEVLEALTNAEGVFSNVPDLRDQFGADLVTLIRTLKIPDNKEVYCGYAWLLGSFDYPQGPNAYSVISVGEADGYICDNYVLVHELGHNLGCAHDKEHSSAKGIFDYSYGYGIEGEFGTIMSYYFPTWGYFSNPNITHDGYVLGIENEADNAQTIRQTKDFVANYRNSVVENIKNNLGDVSGDGKINIVDALMVARLAVGLPVTNCDSNTADVNCDGKVAILDALLIARKSVGLDVPSWCSVK